MKISTSKKNSDFREWEEIVCSELKASNLSGFNWQTPEGIELKALYTASDLEKLEWVDSLPGLFPFIRGPMACLLYTSPSPRDLSTSRMPSSA